LYLPALALLVAAAAASPWWSVQSLREALPAGSTPVAYWRGTDAAFLAAAVPGKSVQSVVRIEAGAVEFRFDGAVRGGGEKPIESLDLAGVRHGKYVVLFHTEQGLARSALSFDTAEGNGEFRFIVTGMAPGMWEIWRNGWVVDIGVPVRKGESVLSFQGRAGSYFIRRLN
jgi:hypothetical protein